MNKMNMYAELLINEARRRRIEVVEIDSRFNLFSLTHSNKTICCRESLTELTSAYTMMVCANKWLTSKFLRQAGLSVPEQTLWKDIKSGLEFLEKCGGRIVVKPLGGEQGKGITVDVRSEDKLMAAVAEAGKYDHDILLERFVEGKDLRVIVINYRFVAAIIRIPASVEGDGESTLRELINKRNKDLQIRTEGESKIPLDHGTAQIVFDQGFSLDQTPPAGLEVQVCHLANFHSGGTIKDVTAKIPQRLKAVCERAAKTLNIPVVGLDLLLPELDGDEYVIIEANERPGLANHEPQPTAERFVDFLFPETAAQF